MAAGDAEGSADLPREAGQMASKLANAIMKNNPLARITSAQVKKWALDFEKCNRLDEHSWQEILQVLEFSQADDFWKTNILSGGKFREQWNKLTAKMAARGQACAPGNAAAPVKGKYDNLGVKV
jgi:hypothetical protein